MTVIYSGLFKGRHNRFNKKNIRFVTAKYINCGAKCGVVDIKNKPIFRSDVATPDLDLSTHYMKFIPKGETKQLDIKTKGNFIIS